MAESKKPKYTADDNPATCGVLVERQKEALAIVRDVWGGTLCIRKKASTYLPRFPNEASEAYAARVDNAILFNGFKRSVRGLAGMVYLNDPEVGKAVPPEIQKELEDVDLQGNDLATFGRGNFDDGMIDGHAAIFVDMQSFEEGSRPQSRGEEKALGLRPYWVNIRKGDLLRPCVTRVNGRVMLQRVAWIERTLESAGAFKDAEVERVRELELVGGEKGALTVAWRLYKQKKESDHTSWVIEKEGVLAKWQEIPVAVTYTGYEAPFESTPPLLDLALENIAHIRKRSDLDNIEHVTAVPILGMFGVDDEEFSSVGVGPAIGFKFADPEASMGWSEISGSGIAEIRTSLKDIERRMAVLGLSMLMSETRAAETATSKRIDKSESDSQLMSAARSHQVALSQALRFHAMWKGVELPEEKAWITVNTDFVDVDMPPEVMRVFVEAVNKGGLPIRVLLDEWQAGGRINPDVDIEELELEILAAAAAVSDREETDDDMAA